MSKKKFLAMILVLGTILAFGVVAMAQVYVDQNTGNDLTSAGSLNNPFKSITFALANLGVNTVVNVDDGSYAATYGSATEVFPIAVPNGITVQYMNFVPADSGGALIDAEGAVNAFQLNAGAAAILIKGFTLKGAVTPTVGAALNDGADIYITGALTGDVTVQDCTFQGDRYGIYLNSTGTGTVKIYDNTFESSITDAGVYIGGAAASPVDISSATGPGAALKPQGNIFSGIGSAGATGGIVDNSSAAHALTVDYNHFNGNRYGVHLGDAIVTTGAVINFNQFVGNTTAGVHNADTAGGPAHDVNCNWWNAATGPTNAALNPTGTGDALSIAAGGTAYTFATWLGHVLWTVNLLAPANNYYNTITNALVPAAATDTIDVDPGTYYKCEVFPLDLDKATLTLKATGAVATTIIKNDAGETVRMSANDVTLGGSGFTVQGVENATTGVRLWNQTQILDGVTVKGNTFLDCQQGVYAGTDGQTFDITNLTVDGNTFTRLAANSATWSEAIVCLGNSNFQLSSALITGNTITHYQEGVSLANVLSSTISNNTISNGYFTGIAVDIWDKVAGPGTGNDVTSNVRITGNTVSNIGPGVTDVGIAIDKSATHPGAGGTITNITVDQNTVSGCANNFYINRFGGAMTQAEVDTFTLRNNSFLNTGALYGVYNSYPGITLDATGNYWGHYSGPEDSDENPTGLGTKTTGPNVTVGPWLTSAYGTSTETHTYYSTGVGGYHMVSTPLDLNNPGSVEQVYDELSSPTLHKWNPGLATPAYDTFTGAQLVKSYWGYWLYLSGDAAITVEGTETALDTVFNFADAGWYQISAPYNFAWDTIGFTDLETNVGGKARIVSYDPATGDYTNHYESQGYVGSAWYGYWVKATAAGATLTLKKADPSLPPSPLWVTMSVPRSMLLPANLEMPPAPPSFIPLGAIPAVKVELATVDGVLTFAASAGEALKVQVFNIGGGLVYDASAVGSELAWAMRASTGELVANGVYLAKVSVKTAAGWVNGGLFRILVLR